MKEMLPSPVAEVDKEILFRAGQKISLCFSTMERKCNANFAGVRGEEQETNSYGLNKQTGAEFQKVKLLFSISIFIALNI